MAAKIESTPGTAETLAAADGAFNVFDPDIQAQVEFVDRPGQGTLSPLAGRTGAEGGQVTFEVELHGSGSAGSPTPAWASTFLPACGFAESSGVFTRESLHPEASGANTKTLTLGVYKDGLLKQIKGAQGTFEIVLRAGQPVRLRFTFTGVWTDPSDVALIAPDYPSVSPLRFVSSGLTIGSWSPKVNEMSIDIGNNVVLREDSANASGYHTAAITEWLTQGSLDPEATLVADNDIFGQWLNNHSEQALSIALGGGSANGNTVAIASSKFQWRNVQEGDRNGIAIDNPEFQLNRATDAGDDEISITFA